MALRPHLGRAHDGAAARVALRRWGGRASSGARSSGAGGGTVERSHGPRPGHRARRRWPACGLRPPRRWRGERLVTMSAWRWGVYRVSYYVGRGLIRAARLLAYATAGVLTRKELGRAAAGRWSDFGIDETYVLSGLFTWEENFYFRFLKPDDHVLIVGAGSGRDLIGLPRVGRPAGVDWTPLPTDVIMFEHGGLHFEHQFLPGEIEYEAQSAGLTIAAHQVGDDGLIMLMAD